MLTAALIASALLKQHHARHVSARAYDELEAELLKDNGADDLLFPEQEMAEHLAKQMYE